MQDAAVYKLATTPLPLYNIYLVFLFFFQAEDGIRDSSVTGVQTCALPISAGPRGGAGVPDPVRRPADRIWDTSATSRPSWMANSASSANAAAARWSWRPSLRSEEGRVGRECRSRGAPVL